MSTETFSSICGQGIAAILKNVDGGVDGQVSIIGSDNTDLILKVPYRGWTVKTGKRRKMGVNVQYAEVVTSFCNANGIYMLCPGDFFTNPLNGPNKLNEVIEKISLTIRENRIVEIQGGVQAETLKILIENQDPKAFNLTELAIGFYPAKPSEIYCSVGGIYIAVIKFGLSVFFKADRLITVLRNGKLVG